MPCRAGARGVSDLAIGPGRMSSCNGVNDFLMEAVEMWYQLQPEGHLVGPIVISDTRLQANMQVLFVFGAELGPDDLLKAIRLGVDESGVLRNRKVRISCLGEVGPVCHDDSAEHYIVLAEVTWKEVSGSHHGDPKHVGDFISVGCVCPVWPRLGLTVVVERVKVDR